MIIIIIIVRKPDDLSQTHFPGSGTGKLQRPNRTRLIPQNNVALDAIALKPFRVR